MIKKNKSFQNNEAKLYLVGTPIGNLQDISRRALETLLMVDVIFCEDTKNTIRLLSHFEIKKPLYSLHEHNEKEKSLEILKRIEAGDNVAYVSDAGNPLISDPGSILVKMMYDHDINVVTVLGPSAFLHALINSTFDTSSFLFEGFLERQESKRLTQLERIKMINTVTVLYEAPHRIKKLLESINKVIPDRKLCLARELTKLHEEFIYGTAAELLSLDFNLIKGEIVLVIDKEENTFEINDQTIIDLYRELSKDKNLSTTDIVKKISDALEVKKNHVYQLIETYRKEN